MDIVQFVYYQSDPEEKKVLEYTFGLGGNPKLTSQEIALRINKPVSEVRDVAKKLAQTISESGAQY
jgi:hypothetical protein